jgi:D-tagatose-1,6-bisphosphate aldolase subunit GatZ/KbaZ
MYEMLKQLGPARSHNEAPGIYSVCSSHVWVLEAAMRHALKASGPLLIEATCNQVNQFGGYTGMTPAQFRRMVIELAARTGFPPGRLLLGGDHLGPYPWQSLPADEAMKNATDMVQEYVREGFGKIHLDASMPCYGDPEPLPGEVIAQRAALLAQAAESCGSGREPVYVIGTEVPTPGGAVETLESAITSPDAAEHALFSHRTAFSAAHLSSAWSRVIALVVQPGVEFGHEEILGYDSASAKPLSRFLLDHPALVFEAHSTDYQKPQALRELVCDGFAILKVGPALTYSMRQAIFALARIEEQTVQPGDRSNLLSVLTEAMLRHPAHWQRHYQGSAEQQRRLLFFSYSDRIRYYWTDPAVRTAIETLIGNLEQQVIPETLLSEFLPVQYAKVRAGALKSRPTDLIFDKIGEALTPYSDACSGGDTFAATAQTPAAAV